MMCKKGVQLNERLLKHFFISSYHIVLQLNTTPNTIFSLYSPHSFIFIQITLLLLTFLNILTINKTRTEIMNKKERQKDVMKTLLKASQQNR